MNMWIVQRYDGPTVGWYTISPEYATRYEAHVFLGSIKQTPGALYAVSHGGMP
jgi:hypothetical protein